MSNDCTRCVDRGFCTLPSCSRNVVMEPLGDEVMNYKNEEQKKIARAYHEKILQIAKLNREAMELLDKL